MMILRVLLLVTATATAAWAQTNTPGEVRRLSLQDCVELSLRNNLQLQIERYNPQISLYNVQGAYGAYEPTLNLSGQHDHREAGSQLLGGGFSIPGSVSDDNSFSGGVSGISPIGTTYSLQGNSSDTYGYTPTIIDGVVVKRGFENTVGSASMSVSQPLLRNLWIDSYRLNIRVAKNRLKYSEQALKLQIMQTLTAVEQAYYDLIAARENVVVQQKAVELAERLVAENQKRLEVGALAPLDLESAKAQAATTRSTLIATQIQRDTQERLLKSLITDKYRKDWADPADPTKLEPAGDLTAQRPVVDVQDSWSKGLSMRPEIEQAKLDIERQGIVLKYDKNQLLPELDVFGTYGFNGSGKEFSDTLYDIQSTDRPFYTYGGRISLPLFNSRARNAYRADKANLQQLVLTLKQLEQNTLILIDNDIGNIKSSFEGVEATKQAREFQESALKAEQTKLENGKSTTYTVLQVQRDVTAARGSEIGALNLYKRYLSQLSLHEGSTLQRLGINLDVK